MPHSMLQRVKTRRYSVCLWTQVNWFYLIVGDVSLFIGLCISIYRWAALCLQGYAGCGDAAQYHVICDAMPPEADSAEEAALWGERLEVSAQLQHGSSPFSAALPERPSDAWRSPAAQVHSQALVALVNILRIFLDTVHLYFGYIYSSKMLLHCRWWSLSSMASFWRGFVFLLWFECKYCVYYNTVYFYGTV